MHTHIHTEIYIPTYVRTYMHAFLYLYLPTYLPTCPPTYLPTYLTYLRTYLPTYLRFTYLCCAMPACAGRPPPAAHPPIRIRTHLSMEAGPGNLRKRVGADLNNF